MSGLKNEPIAGGRFLNFKDGKIISAISGNKEEFTHLEGFVTDLDIVDEEYQGKAYRKIVLFVKDDENEIWKLGFPLESGYGNAFCSLALNIDFNKPVKISGGIKDMENGKSYGMLFVKQPDGETWKNLKWFYTKDSTDIPGGLKARDRSGEYMDYSKRNDFFHSLLIEDILPRIKHVSSFIGGAAMEIKPNEVQARTKAGKKSK